jgi:uncharacterized OsmC-like protein
MTAAADDRWSVVTARTTSTGITGRAISKAGPRNFVVDDGVASGGPGEESTATEVFLSGVTSCAVLLISRVARADGIPLRSAEAQIDAVLDKEFGPEGPRTFDSVRLTITLRGVSEDQADVLIRAFKARCPLYGSLALAVKDTSLNTVIEGGSAA